MKKYIALCILLTVAGAFLCVDMRTFELVKSIKSDFECQGFCYKIPENESDKLVKAYIKGDFSYKNIQKIRPDDYVWLVHTAWMNDFQDPHFAEIVAKLRKLDLQL